MPYKPLNRWVVKRAEEDGAPDRIRTCDLRLRRPTLYPAELRALIKRINKTYDLPMI